MRELLLPRLPLLDVVDNDQRISKSRSVLSLIVAVKEFNPVEACATYKTYKAVHMSHKGSKHEASYCMLVGRYLNKSVYTIILT